MTRRLLPALLGKRGGEGQAHPLCVYLSVCLFPKQRGKKVLPPTAAKLPDGGRRADGSQGLNVAGAAPHVLPDTLNPEQVAATNSRQSGAKAGIRAPQ